MSKRYNAMTDFFEEVTILDMPALFTGGRIDDNTVPDGYHVYEVRHDDDCRGDAVQLAKHIIVNHWGSLITRDEIEAVTKDGYLYIEPDALNYGAGDCRTMKEFMEKYPPFTKPAIEFEVKHYTISKDSGAVKINGYTLTEHIDVGSKMFIKGENPGEGSPFMTLQHIRGSLCFSKERYFQTHDDALKDIHDRAKKEYEKISSCKLHRPKNLDKAR